MTVSFKGFGENAATFSCPVAVDEGSVVKITANGTVGACSDGDKPCGIVVSYRDGYASVQLRGYARVPYSGNAPALGYTSLAANASGGVKAASTGISVLVLDVDTADTTVGIIL